MATATDCPAPHELNRLLDGSLSSERQRECTRHLDECPCCQEKLEQIAAAGTNLIQLVEHLDTDRPAADSAYWPAVQALSANFDETFVPRSGSGSGVRRRDPSLEFLMPATDPAYLGRLAQFDVMRIIGRGGMGLVLEAFDSRLQRNVAIKVLDPEYADDDTARQRFCREARAAASVTHENVVAVHQVERSDEHGLPYLVMQLVAGESLEDRLLREKALPFREVVRIGLQAAQGLVAAHAQGLVHRDIKPGNILLEPPNDRVKLTDFGLARVVDDVKLTKTGFVTGTPLYMAPEQSLGEEADPRSDLFSLGAVLYEMASGQPPFTGPSALVILRQITEAKHRPLREVNPAIPDWFSSTIDRLLEKKPADRIQTAAQLAELLEFEWALMKTTSEDVPQVCQIEARKEAIRNRWIAAGIGAGFLTLGLIGGLFLASRGSSDKEPAAAATSAPIVPTAVADSKTEPVVVLKASAGTVWSVAFDPANDLIAMAVEDGSVRLWDWRKQSVTTTLNAHRGVVWQARFLKESGQLATAGDDGFIKLWAAPFAEPTKSFRHANAARGFAFSRDEQKLFAGDRDGGLKVWSLTEEEPLAETRLPGAIYALALSPDESIIATAGSDRTVRLWDSQSLAPRLPLEGHAGPVYSVGFHPEGRLLASAGWDKTIRLWDVGSGELKRSWEAHDGDIWSVVFSPDGKRLASGGHDGVVKVWDVDTGKRVFTGGGNALAVHTLTFDGDGRHLASGGRDGAVRIWKME